MLFAFSHFGYIFISRSWQLAEEDDAVKSLEKCLIDRANTSDH